MPSESDVTGQNFQPPRLGPVPDRAAALLAAGAGLTLDGATLDRIDEIVPPGTDVYPPDGAWQNRALTDPTRRRRAQPGRAARD
jgi:hypothetical protein